MTVEFKATHGNIVGYFPDQILSRQQLRLRRQTMIFHYIIRDLEGDLVWNLDHLRTHEISRRDRLPIRTGAGFIGHIVSRLVRIQSAAALGCDGDLNTFRLNVSFGAGPYIGLGTGLYRRLCNCLRPYLCRPRRQRQQKEPPPSTARWQCPSSDRMIRSPCLLPMPHCDV